MATQPAPRSRIQVYNLASFDALCHDNTPAGAPYRDAVKKHSADLAKAYVQDHPAFPRQERITVLGVPRGGLATAEALKEVFSQQSPHPGQVVLVESRIKQSPGSLYPDGTFEKSSTLVISDGVIASGKTIIDHLQQVPAAWNGVVKVFANAAARLGLAGIGDQAEKMPQAVESAVGRLFEESECKWVDLPGKKVYFVGMDYNLPDFGDHTAPSAPAPK